MGRVLSCAHEMQRVRLLQLWHIVVDFVSVFGFSELKKWLLNADVFVVAFCESELASLLKSTHLSG